MEQSERKWPSPPPARPSVITPGDIWPFKKQFGATKSRQWHAAGMRQGGRQHGSQRITKWYREKFRESDASIYDPPTVLDREAIYHDSLTPHTSRKIEGQRPSSEEPFSAISS